MSRKGENITKRKDGRWEARLIYGYDDSGKAKYKYFYADSYSKAKAKKEFAQSELFLQSSQIPPNALTINDLIGEFLIHKKATVKISTMAHYENILKNHVVNSLGTQKLMYLKSTTIDEFSRNLLTCGTKSGDGLSPKTVRDVLSLLHSLFKYAVKQKYMSSEILNFSMPRLPSKETVILKDEDRVVLENFAMQKKDSYRFGMLLCLYTGLRIGEICALKWSDIDFEQSTLSVKRTIQRVSSDGNKKTELMIGEPKTRTSIRTIPLPSFLLSELTIQKINIRNNNAYVLTGRASPIEPSNYYMKYKRWLKKLDIKSYSFHALRHTFATSCIEKGFDAKSLSEILGHSDVKITLNRYVHPSMELKRQHMEKLTPAQFQSESVSNAVGI